MKLVEFVRLLLLFARGSTLLLSRFGDFHTLQHLPLFPGAKQNLLLLIAQFLGGAEL